MIFAYSDYIGANLIRGGLLQWHPWHRESFHLQQALHLYVKSQSAGVNQWVKQHFWRTWIGGILNWALFQTDCGVGGESWKRREARGKAWSVKGRYRWMGDGRQRSEIKKKDRIRVSKGLKCCKLWSNSKECSWKGKEKCCVQLGHRGEDGEREGEEGKGGAWHLYGIFIQCTTPNVYIILIPLYHFRCGFGKAGSRLFYLHFGS